MRRGFVPFVAVLLALPGVAARAQDAQETPEGWTFHASAAAYFLAEESNYVQPTFVADRDRLHLEARNNYEARDTGSTWVGYNLHVGKKLSVDFTPMFGAAFGSTRGVAPGYHFTLDWWRLELYSEGEYLYDTGERDDSFFYSWSELSISPLDWLHAGLVGQRTRVYRSERDIQRGPFVGVGIGRFEITAYAFDPDQDDATYVVSFSVEF